MVNGVLFIAAVALLLLAAGCSNGTAGDEAPAAPGKVEQARYPVPGSRAIPLDIYAPDPKKNLHRALVLIHGGGWVGGSRLDMSRIAEQLAADGFTVANIDYTLAGPGSRWPAQLGDVRAAVRYVRSRAKELGIDPDKMAAAGVSAGGHLSMFLGTTEEVVNGVSSHVQAVGSISGVLDLNRPLTPAGENYHIVQQLLVGTGEPTVEMKKQASPVTFITKSAAPTFFIHGSADPLVPIAQSEDAGRTMATAEVDTRSIIVPMMGHGLNLGNESEKAALQEMAKWLTEKLR